MQPLSVVVDDLNVFRSCCGPFEADPPLLIHTDAVHAGAITLQFLKPVARRHSQIPKGIRGVENEELAQGHPLGVLVQLPYSLPVPDALGVLVPE